ncbi:MAG: OadG family protein [Oscillospiraceae bacterium]|nr:OadG family protein [Oscillospiraceae bacterium]
MNMLSGDLIHLGLADAGIIALLGYGVVFLGLIFLMIVVILLGKAFSAAGKKKAAAPAPVEETVEEAPKPVAPGAAGELKLHNVEPKIAAMLMAIVADKLGKPLNELRFISIKEVE